MSGPIAEKDARCPSDGQTAAWHLATELDANGKPRTNGQCIRCDWPAGAPMPGCSCGAAPGQPCLNDRGEPVPWVHAGRPMTPAPDPHPAGKRRTTIMTTQRLDVTPTGAQTGPPWGGRIIEPPPMAHDCRGGLPWDRNGYGSTGHEDGALAQCGICGRWWVSRPCGESLGPTSWWRPVRWYHRALRERIAQAAR